MIAPTNIQPPKNWQDFEMLCLKLWGEIWAIPHEIEFNSDNSQGQQGVDIYGPIDGGLKYYGVQCKNKKLNLINGEPNRITIADIQAEIDKALAFEPALSKLVIATSLQKDQKVEAFVRTKSQEQVSQGLFSIQICFWDFFERKLPEFPKVQDWYLKHENFHRVREMTASFSEGEAVKIFYPKFQKNVKHYVLEKVKEPEDDLSSYLALSSTASISKFIAATQKANAGAGRFVDPWPRKDWKQYLWFHLYFKNSGDAVIEDFKIELDFSGDFEEVGPSSPTLLNREHFSTNVRGYSNSKTALWLKPDEKALVQGDTFSSNNIYLMPSLGVAGTVKIYWRLLSRDFEDNGMLEMQISPKYFTVSQTVEVKTVEEEKVEEFTSFVQRRPSSHMLFGSSWDDNESDYTFE